MANFKNYNQVTGQWEDIAVGVMDDGTNRYTPADIKGIDDKVTVLQGLNEYVSTYTYNGDGMINMITVKDKNNNTVSTTTLTYTTGGDVNTSVLVQNGQTITTQFNYDTNGNLISTTNTKS